MNKISCFNLFNFVFFVLITFLSLTIPVDNVKWQVYSDTHDYLHQSRMPLTDLEFYVPSKQSNFYPRPFTVPLFYKICGSEQPNIVIAQRIVHFLSAFFLAYALSLFISTSVLKYIVATSLYLTLSWWNILEWTMIPLSESLSLTFLLCWLASFLLLLNKKNTSSFIIHVLFTLLFSFTRDTWPYILVVFYCIFVLIFFIWQKELLKKSLAMLAFCCVLFFIQQYTSEFGNRHRLPVTNSLIIRIIPNQEYLQWFIDEGMPCSDNLKKNFSDVSYYNQEKRVTVYHLYSDTTYNELHHWINTEGKGKYTKFLFTHPAYFCLLEESPEFLQRIFAGNLFYISPPLGYSSWLEPYFPIFNWQFLLLLLLAIVLLFIRYKKIILLVPVVLVLVFLENVLLSYNADAFEVERHLFITNIMVQLISILSLAILADHLISTIRQKKAEQ